MPLLEIFIAVSIQYSIPSNLLSSICMVESSHKIHAINPNDGGSDSLGVCQIKLSTAKSVGYTGNKKGLLDPNTNINYAGKYLRKCFDKHKDWIKAVKCYNRGYNAKIGSDTYEDKVLRELIRSGN